MTFESKAYRVDDDVLTATVHQTVVLVDLEERKACPDSGPSCGTGLRAFEGDDLEA